jgi:hypothetical protein
MDFDDSVPLLDEMLSEVFLFDATEFSFSEESFPLESELLRLSRTGEKHFASLD